MTEAIEEADEDTLGKIKRHAGLGMLVGIGIAIAGVLSVLSPFIAGLSVTIAVGVLLIVSGASRLYFAFKMGSFGAGLLVFLLGLLTLGAGGYLVTRPDIGLSALTLFLAVYFVADGIIEIIWSFRLRPIEGWVWTLLSGIAALALGIMIWRQFPVSGKWAVGTITGIHMILAGSAIALLSRAARRDAKDALAA